MKKKITLTLLAIVCTFCCAFGLVACGASGTYKLDSMTITVGDKEITAKAGESLDVMGDGTWLFPVDKEAMVITLNSDGTFVARANMGDLGGSSSTEGTWEETDGKVTLKVDGKESGIYTLEGNTLVMEEDGMKIVLKK